MIFTSKTALIEHIKELVKEKYLSEHWEIEQIPGGTKGYKYYTINFDGVKKE